MQKLNERTIKKKLVSKWWHDYNFEWTVPFVSYYIELGLITDLNLG